METTRLLKIMSSESKAKIIFKLYGCDCKKSNVNSLCDEFELKQPNLSKHLMDLRAEGIVEFEKNGKEANYKLSKEFSETHGKLIEAIANNSNNEFKLNECSCDANCRCNKK